LDICVLRGSHADRMSKLCSRVKVREGLTAKDFIKGGFTNYSEPVLYYCRRIKEKDNYPVSFSISLDKATLEIKEFCLLDEEFCQPHPCGKDEYRQVKEQIRHLVNRRLFEVSEPVD